MSKINGEVMKEEWRDVDIDGYSVHVSSWGRVMSNVGIEIYEGNVFVQLKKRYVTLAKLVAMAFLNTPDSVFVFHKNQDKRDNRVDNLKTMGKVKLRRRWRLLTKRVKNSRQKDELVKYNDAIKIDMKEKQLTKQLIIFNYIKYLEDSYQYHLTNKKG